MEDINKKRPSLADKPSPPIATIVTRRNGHKHPLFTLDTGNVAKRLRNAIQPVRASPPLSQQKICLVNDTEDRDYKQWIVNRAQCLDYMKRYPERKHGLPSYCVLYQSASSIDPSMYGVFTSKDIPRGTFIAQWIGNDRVIPNEDADINSKGKKKVKGASELGTSSIDYEHALVYPHSDGHHHVLTPSPGSAPSLMNHAATGSAACNCTVVGANGALWMQTKQNIGKGTELCWEYSHEADELFKEQAKATIVDC